MIYKNCKTCENAIFDPVWGQYKCKRLAHSIDDTERYNDCDYWVENPNQEPTITKRWTK